MVEVHDRLATRRQVPPEAQFSKHAFFALLALYAASSNPVRLAWCLLAASALNVLPGVRPERRLLHEHGYGTTYALLSFAGQSVETSYYLLQMTGHLGDMLELLILLSFALVLLVFALDDSAVAALQYDAQGRSLHARFRSISWKSPLLAANKAAEVLWYMQLIWSNVLKGCSLWSLRLIWSILYTGGFWSTTVRLALIVGLPIAPFALYQPMCSLQDGIGAWRIRRARGAHGNIRSAATRLPIEVQLLIFHLLRTRGRFGAHENLRRDTPFQSNSFTLHFSACRDLAAASRVCVAWRGAAIEALYRDAVLRKAGHTFKFSRTLTSRPERALLVRRIMLPECDERSLRANETKYGTSWTRFSAAVEHIMMCCVGATDIRLFRGKSLVLSDISGLHAASSRVSHLALHGNLYARLWPPHEPAAVNISLLLALLPHLRSLTLTGQKVLFDGGSFSNVQRHALAGIQELHLAACALDIQHLVSLLRQLRNLRVAELRNLEFCGVPGWTSVAELFATQLDSLADLRILFDGETPVSRCRIQPIVHGPFSALRSLTVNARMLPKRVLLPHSVEELILAFGPHSCLDGRDAACRKILLDAVRAVRDVAATAPALRYVQLWDDVRLAQLGHWSVAAFILRGKLAPAGIALSVNLTIAMIDVSELIHKFEWQKTLRRIRWAGVF